ncbi:MAG: M20/M25/M40 family metallo-hydrolase, partial [Clostridia bacterium]|nr:M20/M25/M40 family metallo-hydrolase [Clostridia bacterium]
MEEIKQIVEDIYEDVVRVRRHIHQHPELDFHEFETAAYICNYLDSLGICYEKNIAKTGVVGLIDTQSDKTLLIRADMDALPMQEEADVPFKSKNDGVMHACGHDAH